MLKGFNCRHSIWKVYFSDIYLSYWAGLYYVSKRDESIKHLITDQLETIYVFENIRESDEELSKNLISQYSINRYNEIIKRG